MKPILSNRRSTSCQFLDPGLDLANVETHLGDQALELCIACLPPLPPSDADGDHDADHDPDQHTEARTEPLDKNLHLAERVPPSLIDVPTRQRRRVYIVQDPADRSWRSPAGGDAQRDDREE